MDHQLDTAMAAAKAADPLSGEEMAQGARCFMSDAHLGVARYGATPGKPDGAGPTRWLGALGPAIAAATG